MTKKDYIAIANAIRIARSYTHSIDGVVDELCVMFKRDNPNFDPQQFKEACKE